MKISIKYSNKEAKKDVDEEIEMFLNNNILATNLVIKIVQITKHHCIQYLNIYLKINFIYLLLLL